MRISDWSSDVCSSDLIDLQPQPGLEGLLTTTHKFDRAPEASFTLGGHYEYPDPVLGGSLNFDLNYYWTDSYIVGLARFDSYNLLNGHIAINNIKIGSTS